MATRGRKPKPAHLKLVQGNPGKRKVDPDAAPDVDASHDNGLEPPRKLKKREQELWDAYIRRAPWLTHFDVPRAFVWVSLQAEYERKPADMVASRIAQLRAVGSELGLDPASRARIGGSGGGKKEPERPESEFGL